MALPLQTVNILFFGDIVGRPGREAVERFLHESTEQPDIVIANVENATHGFGLSYNHYQDLRQMGVDIMTGGNHIWDRKDIFDYIHQADRLVRPANMPLSPPGQGYAVFEIRGVKIGIVNLMGQVFMGQYNSPVEALQKIMPELLKQTPIVFVDIHAEATAEKISMAYLASSLGASAMTGTHTHVQTADERLLNDRMGYITDAGFNGAHNSVIGMDVMSSMARLTSLKPTRMEVAQSSTLQVNAVQFTVEKFSGKCKQIRRINQLYTHESSVVKSKQS
jgi:hypothetical protein